MRYTVSYTQTYHGLPSMEACVAHRIGELHQLVRAGGTEQHCEAMDVSGYQARVGDPKQYCLGI